MAESTFKIEPIVEKDVENVMSLLKRTFYLDEPMNKALGLCNETTDCPELDGYCKSSLLEGLSFKAVDSEANIIGVIINGVCPLKAENGNYILAMAEQCQNPKFKKILYILARREEGSRLWEKFPNESSLVEVKVASTDPSWRNRGIMNMLVAEAENLVKQRGIRLLRMDTSSAYSAKSAERLGFTCMYRALYTDIKMDGQPLIVPETPHLEDRVYIKKLFD